MERVPGKARIVVVGDSFTFGHGVENSETYCRLLEKNLRDTEVINLGVSAFGTDQQLLMLRDEGLPYRPDLVILGLYLGDVFRNIQSRRGVYCKPLFVIRDDQLTLTNVPVPRKVPAPSFTTRVLNRSRLYSRLRYRLVWLVQHHGFGSSWEVTEKIVETMNTEVRAAGSELLVVAIAADTGIYGKGLGRSTHRAAMEHLVDLLERSGVEYINSTERFAKVAGQSEQRLYYARDGHFTREGHALMAGLIQEHLESRGMVYDGLPRPSSL